MASSVPGTEPVPESRSKSKSRYQNAPENDGWQEDVPESADRISGKELDKQYEGERDSGLRHREVSIEWKQ
jgi:hypothetical protein